MASKTKIVQNPIDKNEDDFRKYFLYIFMMKIIGNKFGKIHVEEKTS